MSNIIVEFKGKITKIDGIRYVRIPKITPSHVVQGDRTSYTPNSLTTMAELIGYHDNMRSIDHPRLTHVSGEFIGTFRLDLGTRQGYKAARDIKQAIVTEFYDLPYDNRTEGLLEMEERAYQAAMAALAENDK